MVLPYTEGDEQAKMPTGEILRMGQLHEDTSHPNLISHQNCYSTQPHRPPLTNHPVFKNYGQWVCWAEKGKVIF